MSAGILGWELGSQKAAREAREALEREGFQGSASGGDLEGGAKKVSLKCHENLGWDRGNGGSKIEGRVVEQMLI